ncbi:MAG: hypothetical protein A2X67_14430 [Ignavibacteria bacterium GWA2_55_11]|nr:MAG: hypothetical protein A2X67_14430 [Ignavibacteria bacterium GWA2_55_11]OGU46866.1 MAG: hypothetical protein A2X68_10960 [Ignavibacteria bacterium GWC2_56_12]OGU68438.1 MAG: hypothetical protein A3C56_07515 [Ignavibacteria bacterium RIFCSPHIGHO2_02_FULL_56_12]OGU75749.1 MAG: hypothetical protein A3H45_05870 [Ignavibacteria bacterium RIFCSPLOWO2_02_FULL_55_14]OGU76843.1 MAG: hypothetical protein A3G43_09915 [Ignavibacteria bacterium RIFCSPLOWO2_12_FULL_56_21]
MNQPQFPLAPFDIALIVAFAVAVLVIGFRTARRGHESDEFLAAGRSLTLPVFVATLVSTWYGGILGVGEFSYTHGLSTWTVFGLPYYVFAVLFAFFLAPRIRRSNVLSIPDRFEDMYGRPAALGGAILTFLLVNPAPYVLMLGLLSQMFFGGDLLLHLCIGTAVSGMFLLVGGFRSGVMTNVAEFLLMYLGFAVMVAVAVTTFGGFDFLTENVPPEHLTLTGGQSPQYILVWFLIALWTMVDPSFHQRSASAKDERTARNGVLVSVFFWFLFDAMTVSTGLYARAILPRIDQAALSYPALANAILPVGLRGLFYVGLFATVMSTLTSMLMLSGLTAGRDIGARWAGRNDEKLIQRWVRLGLGGAAGLSIVLAWLMPSVVTLWYSFGTCLIPGLLLPVLGAYVPRLRIQAGGVLAVMISGTFVSTSCLVWGMAFAGPGGPAYPLGIEPLLPGLGVSACVWLISKVLQQRFASAR